MRPGARCGCIPCDDGRWSGDIDWLSEHWDAPDEGVWETRGGRQDFVYGRINSWTAFDRAIRLAADTGRPGNVARWLTERDHIYRQVMDRGWHDQRGAFVQHYDTDVLDASLLRMVQVGIVTPEDPRWLSTLDEMDSELVSDSLVYRYNPEASPDGLRGAEGTFSLCTFWYVDALARSGRLEEAQLIFEKMFTYANHLGLYSEEIGLTGEQLRQLPAGLHPSRADQRCAHPQRPTRQGGSDAAAAFLRDPLARHRRPTC